MNCVRCGALLLFPDEATVTARDRDRHHLCGVCGHMSYLDADGTPYLPLVGQKPENPRVNECIAPLRDGCQHSVTCAGCPLPECAWTPQRTSRTKRALWFQGRPVGELTRDDVPAEAVREGLGERQIYRRLALLKAEGR